MDLSVHVDVAINPGPYNPQVKSIQARNYLRVCCVQSPTRLANSSFNAKITYSKQQLFTCRSRLSIPKTLFMSLKELGILKTRRVCAGLSAKSKTRAIPVICGTRGALKSIYCRSNSHCGINKNNLIYASLDCSSPLLDRLPATLSLSLYLWNARSVGSKTGCFLDFISEYRPDIFALTETWLSPNDQVTRAAITPAGYKLTDCPRNDRMGGGTGLLYSENIAVQEVDSGALNSFEFSEYVVKHGNNNFHICIIYRPPYSASHPVTIQSFFQQFSGYLETVIFSPEPLLICGDFNIHVEIADNPDAVTFLDMLESMALKQYVNFSTHEHGHTLDLIITRSSDSIILNEPKLGPFLSDHCIINCQLNVRKAKPTTKQVTFRRTKAISI